MTTTTTTQRLTNRTGNTLRAKVTYHAPIHGKALTACGITFAALGAQDFTTHQTSPSADLSDVNCPACKAILAQVAKMGSTAVYPGCCTSAYCGKLECPSTCGNLVRLSAFRLWKELHAAIAPDSVWCPNVYEATR